MKSKDGRDSGFLHHPLLHFEDEFGDFNTVFMYIFTPSKKKCVRFSQFEKSKDEFLLPELCRSYGSFWSTNCENCPGNATYQDRDLASITGDI